MAGTAGTVSVEITIGDEETLIDVVGSRDAAVVVYSESGEEVYLPPDPEADAEPDAGGRTTPYEGDPPNRSPYEEAPASHYGDTGREIAPDGTDRPARSVGVMTTPEGFRVFHPEPVTDLRVVRDGAHTSSR